MHLTDFFAFLSASCFIGSCIDRRSFSFYKRIELCANTCDRPSFSFLSFLFSIMAPRGDQHATSRNRGTAAAAVCNPSALIFRQKRTHHASRNSGSTGRNMRVLSILRIHTREKIESFFSFISDFLGIARGVVTVSSGYSID